MSTSRISISLLLIVLAQFKVVAQEDWTLIKNRTGIKVYTRNGTNSNFKEFKASMQIYGTLHRFLAVLYDVEGLPEWGYNIYRVELLERPDELRQIYHAVAKSPWPYKDRDGVYENRFTWNKLDKILRVNIELLKEPTQMSDDFVRLKGRGHWQVREISSGKIEVIFQMQINPGGNIKPWMANIFVSESPYETMLGLRRVIQDPKYHDQNYKFLGN